MVQGHDTTIDRLRHRRETLSEMAELARVEGALSATEASLADTSGRRDDAVRHQSHLEADLASVEARIVEVDRRLYSGAVTIPRELQAMQTDRDLLAQRRSALEDEVLEAMGEREPLDEAVSMLEAERQGLDEEGARLRVVIAEAQVGIDAGLAGEEAERTASVTGLPTDLVALYEGLRARHGGVGAAPLVGGQCHGCFLALPATEIDRIKREPPETLVTCDQCGRILVRP